MFKNAYCLVLGVVLGFVLGFLVCDDTKKKITKTIHNKAKRLSGCVRSSSEKVEEAIHGIKSAVKG